MNMTKTQKRIITALCILFGIGTVLFYQCGCAGDDGKDGATVTIPLECGALEKENDDGDECVALEQISLTFYVVDATVVDPRPGEYIGNRKLVIPGARIVIRQFIPDFVGPPYAEYVTTELGTTTVSVYPLVPVEYSISKDGYIPKEVYVDEFPEGVDQLLTYELIPNWVVTGEDPPGDDPPIFEVTVVIESVDYEGQIVIETVVIQDPIFNFYVNTIDITGVNTVEVDGDVTVGDVTLNNPAISTNGDIVQNADGDIVITGDDIMIEGTGDTSMNLQGNSSLTLDGDVTVSGPVEIDDVTGQIVITP
jgi:hypothetical protein